jgi:hypothetical protein
MCEQGRIHPNFVLWIVRVVLAAQTKASRIDSLKDNHDIELRLLVHPQPCDLQVAPFERGERDGMIGRRANERE